DSLRTLRHRLSPSSPGNITSRINRSTRWSAMARAISRPSLAVVTLQELLRRYFAISERVSRSSSTTRMLGDAAGMGNPWPRVCGGLRQTFLFLNVSSDAHAIRGNGDPRQTKYLVKIW